METRRGFIEEGVAAFLMPIVGGCLVNGRPDQLYSGWNPGEMDIHFIHTGVGEQTFFIFPDGTTMLLDCGDTHHEKYMKDVPPMPNASRYGGEWVSRYIQRLIPRREIDYAMVSHWHGDHTGDLTFGGKRTADGRIVCGLPLVAEDFRFRHYFDHQYPKMGEHALDPDPKSLALMREWIPYAIARGMQAHRFEVGARNQIRLLRDPAAYPQFEIRNIVANGVIWDGKDGVVDVAKTHIAQTGKDAIFENRLSAGIRIRYGKFSYYTGGDAEMTMVGKDGKEFSWEGLIGRTVGPVDVCKTNHHAGIFGMTPEFVREVRAQTYLSSVWQARMVDHKSLSAMCSRELYPGERYVCFGHIADSVRDVAAAYGADIAPGGHAVVKVAPGGATYEVFTLDATDESMRILARRSFVSRGGFVGYGGHLKRKNVMNLSILLAAVINISPANPRYFETADGRAWIPIGCNICFDRLYDGAGHGDAEVRANFDHWLRAFAANGGNCIRLWAGHRSLEVMPEKAGVYDPERTKTLKGIVALCEELGIKVKITFESFRMCLSAEAEVKRANPKGVNFNYNHVFNRPLYAPYADSVAAFFTSQECRRIYLGKAQYLKDIGFGDSLAVYCWELWNEINCCGTISEYSAWSAWAMGELKRMFPNQMTVNNLGSFSDVGAYQMYDELATEKGNDFMQIHRYLDTGACLDVCRGPMDIVAASAVRELLDRRPDRPAIVAEVGAVQANHAGPFPYYPHDKEGTLLHDAMFAAFFAGSAGCGQFWHWDHQYVDGNNLWWQFRRFANAIEGLDPVAEGFRPFYTESRRLRMYGLRGRKTAVLWCRDKRNSWEEELVHGNAPETLKDEAVPFRGCVLECYLPWEDRHVTAAAPNLPPFRRSIVVRVPASTVEGVVRPH